MYSKDYHDVIGRQPVCPENRARLDVSWICKMLPAGTRDILIRTLSEIQNRLEYLARSVIQDDDPESIAELRASARNIERVIDRLKSKVDAG
jgi:hypothetical protein